MTKSETNRCSQYTVYIGLNDAFTYEQKFDTERYVKIVKNVCKEYRLAFTIGISNGGYFHENGTFVEENSLAVTFVGAEEAVVNEVAADLCAFFNQESVVVSKQMVESYFIKESI